ncbi:MAG: hypothetical protein ACKOTE_03330, partial [Opitutaceae bacterium]
IPIRDMIRVKRAMAGRRTRLVGPNCPGLVTPGTGDGSKGGCRSGIARAAAEGTLPTLRQCGRMEDEAIIETLTQLKGVGRWTVEMFLIFNLGRPDVLPVLDLGVRRGFQLAHRSRQLPEPKALARHGARWAPHRTLATLYLWKAADGAAAPAT